MQQRNKYRQLGWAHPHWDLVRLFRSLRVRNRGHWVEELQSSYVIDINGTGGLPVDPQAARLLADYLSDVESDAAIALGALRDEQEALRACAVHGVTVTQTRTRSTDHHQSAKALVAEVTAIAAKHCAKKGLGLESDPQRRAIWFSKHGLHVCARNLDGAIPALLNPVVVWEIKEYWGKTSGGSKMSDAVYECHLVGRELRDYEKSSGQHVVHVVFVDGRDQWGSRRSDLVRFLDLFHQGLIDYLMVGSQVETEWPAVLVSAT